MYRSPTPSDVMAIVMQIVAQLRRVCASPMVQKSKWNLTSLMWCAMQLAAAILSQLSMPPAEVASAIENFRKNHLSELQARALKFSVTRKSPSHNTPRCGC